MQIFDGGYAVHFRANARVCPGLVINRVMLQVRHWKQPLVNRPMSKKSIALLLAFIVGFLVCVGLGIQYVVHTIPESHARSCLVVNTDLADRAIETDIQQGHYLEAIAKAEGIVWNYPVGAVLPESHPYAKTYASERQKELVRISEALSEATGMEHGTDWKKWREAVSNRGNLTE